MGKQLQDVSIRDLLAVLVSAGIFILLGCHYTIPDQVWSAWLVILTFFFSQKPNGITTEAPKQGE